MRSRTLCLAGLGLILSFGAQSAHAQSPDGLNAPIATGPARAAPLPPPTSGQTPFGPAVPRDLATPRAEVETLTSSAEAGALFDQEEDRIIEIGPNAFFGAQSVDAGEAGGGFLRTNPDFQRKDRKQVGFRFKF